MKGKLSREKYMEITNTEKVSKALLTFTNTLEFFAVFGKHYAKEARNVKYVTTTFVFGKLELW